MNRVAAIIITILALVVIGLVTIAIIANSRDPYGEAAIISAQGQARLDTGMALAGVIGTGGVVIVAIIGVVGFLVLAGLLINTSAGVIAGLIGLLASRPAPAPPVIIERRVMYLPPPGASRRDIWDSISTVQPDAVVREWRRQ